MDIKARFNSDKRGDKYKTIQVNWRIYNQGN